MAKKSGLDRGLDALFLDNTVEGSEAVLSVDEIIPNKDQPRKQFDDAALLELSDSIKAHGVLQPLLVRPMADGTYRLIAGERRYRASRMAGLREVPVTVREMTDEEEAIFALIENLQREDLNPMEEARGLKNLIDSFGLTQEQAAQRVGKSRSALTNALRLLNLPEETAALLENGEISMGHARALLALDSKESMQETAEAIVKENLSVRDTERLVKRKAKPNTPVQKREKKRNSFYDEVELAMTAALGRKVKIYVGKGGKGTLEVEFFGTEDLRRLAAEFKED